MTANEIERSYGVCGLVCALCSYNADCAGCQCKDGDCEIKACCQSKGLTHCYLCGEYPCGMEMFGGVRIRAFNALAKTEGLSALAEYLHKNTNRGIFYHKPDGLTGDYDRCETELEVTELLKNGRPDPYEKCPEYESKNFILRLVSLDDAEDLLKCYSDADARRLFNSDNCTSDFFYSTLDEMRECIKFWLDAYKNRGFIRYGVIDKSISRAVGTVEIFGGERGGRKSDFGVLRIDIKSEYENEEALAELLKIADLFFYDVSTEMFITKAPPEAARRIDALIKNGYTPYAAGRKHYFIKRSPDNGA